MDFDGFRHRYKYGYAIQTRLQLEPKVLVHAFLLSFRLLYPYYQMFTACDVLCLKFTGREFTRGWVTWQENVLKLFSMENFCCFWMLWRKIYFCPKFNLFWWCSSRHMMHDETHICSVYGQPWCIIWTSSCKGTVYYFYYSLLYLQQNNDGVTTMVKIKEMREFHTLDQVVNTTHLQCFS